MKEKSDVTFPIGCNISRNEFERNYRVLLTTKIVFVLIFCEKNFSRMKMNLENSKLCDTPIEPGYHSLKYDDNPT